MGQLHNLNNQKNNSLKNNNLKLKFLNLNQLKQFY